MKIVRGREMVVVKRNCEVFWRSKEEEARSDRGGEERE